MHFHRVPEEKSTRSKTTPLLSYRDTVYIYPETGCVDVVPRGNVSGISCPVVVGNSPTSAFSLPLFLSPSPSLLVDSTSTASPMVLPIGLPSHSVFLSCNPITKLPRVSVFVYLASISYARGVWALTVLKINYRAGPFVVRPSLFSRPVDSSRRASIFAFPAFVFLIVTEEHAEDASASSPRLDYLLAACTCWC